MFPPHVALPGGFRVIGTVTEASAAPAVTVDGTADAAAGGWDPFAGWDGRAG